MVRSEAGLARFAQLGSRRQHLGYGERRAVAPGEPPERAVSDARHRSDEQRVAQLMRADSHCVIDVRGKGILARFLPKKNQVFHGSADGPYIIRRAKNRRAGGKTSSAARAAPRAPRANRFEPRKAPARKSVTRIVAAASRARGAAEGP